MKKYFKAACVVLIASLLPLCLSAQDINTQVNGLHGVLDELYDDMMPLCSNLIGVGQALAGFAALWYIASRVWKHITNAEPIDFYPLFRPFVLGFAIIIFPSVLSLINSVMKPTVTATANMVKGSNDAITKLLAQKEAVVKNSRAWQVYVGSSGIGDRDEWYKYTHDETTDSDEGFFESIGNDIKFAMEKASYNMRNSIKEWLSEILQLLFEAAALCIDTIRTFQLVVLAILGPLVFGLAVFDGFHHTLTSWLARYINIFLWLPVANIFGAIIGKVQERMLSLDISQVQITGDTFFSATDAAYLVFLCIGIVGYFTVPSVASYIITAGGSSPLVQKVNNLFHTTTQSTVHAATSGASTAINMMSSSSSNGASSENNYGAGNSSSSSYMKDKLSGNS